MSDPHSFFAGKADCTSEWPDNQLGLEKEEVDDEAEAEDSQKSKKPEGTNKESTPGKVTPSPRTKPRLPSRSGSKVFKRSQRVPTMDFEEDRLQNEAKAAACKRREAERAKMAKAGAEAKSGPKGKGRTAKAKAEARSKVHKGSNNKKAVQAKNGKNKSAGSKPYRSALNTKKLLERSVAKMRKEGKAPKSAMPKKTKDDEKKASAPSHRITAKTTPPAEREEKASRSRSPSPAPTSKSDQASSVVPAPTSSSDKASTKVPVPTSPSDKASNEVPAPTSLVDEAKSEAPEASEPVDPNDTSRSGIIRSMSKQVLEALARASTNDKLEASPEKQKTDPKAGLTACQQEALDVAKKQKHARKQSFYRSLTSYWGGHGTMFEVQGSISVSVRRLVGVCGGERIRNGSMCAYCI